MRMKNILSAALLVLAATGAALSQSTPNLYTGQVPTAAQWNSYFAAKQDLLQYTPVNKAGDTMQGRLRTVASDTTQSGFSIIPGVAPSAPVDGDVWVTSSGLFARVNSVTVGPIATGTLTSVGQTFTGGLISVAGSPVTTSGTLALTVAGTSGGIPYFSSASTWASSNALTANQLVLGGGAGTAPATLGSLGTTTTVLHGNASGAPSFGAVVLTTDVSGILPAANGGTGIGSGTSGGIPYFSGSTTIASSAALTANLPVIGGGAGVAPSVGTRSGNTTAFVTTTGTQTSGRCVEIDASGNHVASAAACAAAGVSSIAGTANQITMSASTGAVTASLPATVNLTTALVLGSGVTLPAWAVGYNGILQAQGSAFAAAGTSEVDIMTNSYYTGTNYKAIATGQGEIIFQDVVNGWFFQHAASVSAGSNQTMTNILQLGITPFTSCSALTTNGSQQLVCTPSDRRVKNDLGVVTAQAALAKVLALPDLHKFTFKQVRDKKGHVTSYGPTGEHYGWWAQDIKKVDPELVKRREVTPLTPDGELQFDKGEVVPFALAAIKAQQEQIQSLVAVNARLAARLAKLEQRK